MVETLFKHFCKYWLNPGSKAMEVQSLAIGIGTDARIGSDLLFNNRRNFLKSSCKFGE